MNGFKLVVSSLSVGIIAVLIYLFSAYGQFQTHNNEYVGYLVIGFERDTFIPCDDEDRWALAGTKNKELHELYKALNHGSTEAVYAVLNGTVSERGKYGHLGGYEREIQISNIVSISTSPPAQCQAS